LRFHRGMAVAPSREVASTGGLSTVSFPWNRDGLGRRRGRRSPTVTDLGTGRALAHRLTPARSRHKAVEEPRHLAIKITLEVLDEEWQRRRLMMRGGRSTGATVSEMAREITQRELRNGSGEIMRALDRGEAFVVTRNGVPVGELQPLRVRRFVAADAAVAAFAGAPPIKFEQFRHDVDAMIDQDPAPRGSATPATRDHRYLCRDRS
jgi:antitoxin (DNA-binding transcriptional repressor) of toxin-antitoxin stability system